MSYNQNLGQWKLVFGTFCFLKLSWGLENDNTLFKETMITFAYTPKPKNDMMTWSYIPNIDRGPYVYM